MTTTLHFTITFHTPFRVGGSYGADGADLVVDREEPITADHIKGLMRHAAQHTLGLPEAVVGDIFGTAATSSPWAWSAPSSRNWGELERRNRVALDAETHTARTDHLVFAEQLTAESAHFTIAQHLHTTAESTNRHVLVLRCAAAAIHGLGGWRQRGLGWIGVTAADHTITTTDVAALHNLREGTSWHT